MDKSPLRNNRPKPNGNRKGMKNAGFIALIVLVGLIIFAASGQSNGLKEIPATQAISNANQGLYSKIVDNNGQLQITEQGKSQPTLKSNVDPNSSLKDQGLNTSKVQVSYKPATSSGSIWLTLASTVLPVILIGGLLYFMLRSAQGQGNQALSFGKSKARLYGNEKDKVTFK